MIATEKRILVIDPNVTERKDLIAYLKSENFQIEIGVGLKDAVKKISEGSFRCLILDVALPEMKGYEAISIIKSIDPDIKVIMTSNKNTKGLEKKVRQQDIFYYFIKSFEKEELKMAITNALDLNNKMNMGHEAKILVGNGNQNLNENRK